MFAPAVPGRFMWSRAAAMVEIRCYPRDDEVFALRVRTALGAKERHTIHACIPEVLATLRCEYPSCRLVVQDGLARMGDEFVVYAYRDGHALRVGREGPGAMRARRPIEIALGRSVELVIRSEIGLASASRVVERARAAADRGERLRRPSI